MTVHTNEEGQQDVDLDQPYEDKDFQIYFTDNTLLEYLAHLEEDNLFRIHLVQEEEQALEKFKKGSEERILQKQQEIDEVQRNIELLKTSKNVAGSKQNFLESNMRVNKGGK